MFISSGFWSHQTDIRHQLTGWTTLKLQRNIFFSILKAIPDKWSIYLCKMLPPVSVGPGPLDGSSSGSLESVQKLHFNAINWEQFAKQA